MQRGWQQVALKVKTKLPFLKTMGKRYKLVPLLDQHIGKGDFEWEFKYEPKQHDDAWHPSSDCTPSVYELWLQAQGKLPERSFTAQSYKNFMVGHFWHQYLQHILVEIGCCDKGDLERRGTKAWGTVDPLVNPVKPYHWVTGSADAAPCRLPDRDYLLDFKTMNARAFAQESPPGWAADKWECQVNIYMDFFDLRKALIVGINKDTPHDFKEFEYHYNEELVKVCYAKWKLVSQCLDEGIAVPEGEDIPLPLKGVVT